MRYFYLLFIFSLTFFTGFSQTDSLKKKKKQFYVTWGYTRAKYSKSTIHFKNHSGKFNDYTGKTDNYDFTIYNAVAEDRPDFEKIKDVINITVPQYVFRIGYIFNSKWGIELNYDHTKYVVTDWQNVHVKGMVNNNYFDQDTILNPTNFLHFEHTDGANFWMINLVRKVSLFKAKKNFEASWVLKPGAGVVIPRTDVTLFGERLNNNWRVAGWIVGVESGLRMEFFKNGFFEFVGKGSFADYTNCLVLAKGNGKANHYFYTGQLTATLGLKFGSKK
ncbi:MAG: hypothetical protein H0U95_10165 [Bacteroidetes bacterium]|nr:hypothetical protein [Bacteroidota bacterium]